MALKKNADFQTMLNEYLPNELLNAEFIARDYIMKNVKKDNNWATAADGTYNPIIVPFKAAGASSVRYGKYTSISKISEDKYLRGKVTEAKDIHGSLIFNQRDVEVHGKVTPQNFLRVLPDAIEDFMKYMKNVVSIGFLSGVYFAKVTDITDAASGILGVSRPDRFEINQLVEIFNGTTAVYADNGGVGGTVAAEVYVTAIDVSEKKVTFSATRGGAAINFGANVAVGYNFHNHDAYLGAADQTFQNIPDVLLSAANGGSANYLGYAKATYPFLQAYNKDGSSITSTNILEKLFDFVVEMRIYSKAAPTEALMSLRNFAYAMKVLEFQKGAYNVVPGSQKASQFGWMEISIGSPKGGMLKLVGIQEADDDKIIALDWSCMTFHSDGGIRKVMDANGDEFYVERNEDGRVYVVDIDLNGELVITKPHRMGILHSIP